MSLTLATILVLSITSLLASIIGGATGLGGGTLLLAVIILMVETEYVIPLHAALQLISNSTRVTIFWKYINWKITGYFLIGIIPGILLGIYTFSLLEKSTIRFIMALFILISIYLPRFKSSRDSNLKVFISVGFMAGVIGIFFGAIGPFIAPFFLRNDILKEELVATKATVQLITHILKIPLFGFIGINVFYYWPLILILSMFLVSGTIIGKRLLNKLSRKHFTIIFKAILTLISIRLLLEYLI
ncbi:MAG: sulfite exporter TauE/SafE family protein [Candidatus Scalinduaceae bacterium]